LTTHAIYIGPIAHLKGETAIIRTTTHGCVVAQFDKRSLTKSGKPWDKVLEYEPHARFPSLVEPDEPPADALGFGWHAFPEKDFERLQEEVGDALAQIEMSEDAFEQALNHPALREAHAIRGDAFIDENGQFIPADRVRIDCDKGTVTILITPGSFRAPLTIQYEKNFSRGRKTAQWKSERGGFRRFKK